MLPAEPQSRATSSQADLPPSARLALAGLHPAALGTALGCVLAIWTFGVTLWTASAGSAASRHALALLSQYLPGYRVTAGGAILGLLYSFGFGFVAGYAMASTRNTMIRLYLNYLRRRAEQQQLRDILDRLG